MEKIALVIGNGFDLNLGLKTSFGHFLESPQFKKLLDSNNALCNYLNYVNKSARWIDIEKELSVYSVQNPDDINLLKEYKDLKAAFFNYITMIDSNEYEINENSNAYRIITNKIIEKVINHDDFLIHLVNFNYTQSIITILNKFKKDIYEKIIEYNKFLEQSTILKKIIKLNEEFGLPIQPIYTDTNFITLVKFYKEINQIGKLSKHLKIYNPHGSIEKNYIIFGVEDGANISEEHIFLKKTCDPNFQKFPIKIFDDCNKIIIFGHSLGKTDHTYFKNFFLKQCKNDAISKDIFISYYEEKGYYEIMKQLDSLTNKNVAALRSLNNLKLIDVTKENAWLKFEM